MLVEEFAAINPGFAMNEHHITRETAHKLARRTLFSFILTFVLSQIFVFLIMSDEMPNLYFFLRGTHVHHLNYGIFLMAAVCGYSVFRRPTGRAAEVTALLYGVATSLAGKKDIRMMALNDPDLEPLWVNISEI